MCLDPPKERPRLKLLPKQTDRTESSEESEGTNKTSSIFGGAKPVDTAKKEAEIEQKLQVNCWKHSKHFIWYRNYSRIK